MTKQEDFAQLVEAVQEFRARREDLPPWEVDNDEHERLRSAVQEAFERAQSALADFLGAVEGYALDDREAQAAAKAAELMTRYLRVMRGEALREAFAEALEAQVWLQEKQFLILAATR